MDFQEFPKIGRLSRDMVVTEKIDGTNAQVVIAQRAHVDLGPTWATPWLATVGDLVIAAASRSRYITPHTDNHGWAAWVLEHAEELVALGEGRHYGEWWGSGIQRRYGLAEKRFSLFNVGRWVDSHTGGVGELKGKQELAPACCHVVPVLMRWTFSDEKIAEAIDTLKRDGSVAAPGFMNPEGVVIFHSATGTLFKKTIEKDDEPKSKSAA